MVATWSPLRGIVGNKRSVGVSMETRGTLEHERGPPPLRQRSSGVMHGFCVAAGGTLCNDRGSFDSINLRYGYRYARTHAGRHVCTHARTYARTYICVCTFSLFLSLPLSPYNCRLVRIVDTSELNSFYFLFLFLSLSISFYIGPTAESADTFGNKVSC